MIEVPAVALTTGKMTPFHHQRISNIHDMAGRYPQEKTLCVSQSRILTLNTDGGKRMILQRNLLSGWGH